MFKNDQLESALGAVPRISERVSLEQYYSEAGPDYAAWSRNFNMHFGYYRMGANPFNREAMLERMNFEVLSRLDLDRAAAPSVIDLGCGLGATLRSFARRMPDATLLGVTRVPWQVERARELNREAGAADRIRVIEADYESMDLPANNFDAAYALESACHARGFDKGMMLKEARRILRPGGRLVVADGFLLRNHVASGIERRILKRLCECWVIPEFARLASFTARLEELGFSRICVEHLQLRVAPSVLHVPWVTLKFLLTDVAFGERRMTRSRWNNILAPLLLPLASAPLGPLGYCMISATKSAA